MRRHEASSAGTVEGNGNGRANFRRASVTRDASREGDGSGAPVRRRSIAVVAAAFAVLAMLVFAPSSGAAKLVEFGQFGGQPGGAAGHIQEGEGVAVNRTGAGGVEPGEIYVSDTINQRVDQFTKDGEFVRAWGKDVNATEPGTGFETCTAASGDTCQAGIPSGEAGALMYSRGIAVNQQTGNVYVVGNSTHLRVDVFSAEGKFEGSFGFGVNAATPASELQFCTTTTGCLNGEPTAAAGGFSEGIIVGSIAIDPTSGNVWVGDTYNHRVNEFSINFNGAGELAGASFVRALGWDIDASAPAEELQDCTDLTGCQAGTAGAGEGQLDTPVALAVDSGGSLYVSSIGPCTDESPCTVMKFNADGTFKEQFGPSSGGESKCQLNFTNGKFAISNSVTSIAVDPTDQHVLVTVKTADKAFQICEFDGEGKLLENLLPEPGISFAYTGVPTLTLAVGPGGRVDVLGPNESQSGWPVRIYGDVPAAPAEVLPATELTGTTATLNGEITTPEPGGSGFDVRYRFEYSGDGGATWLRAPVSGTAAVGSTLPGPHAVHQSITKLESNTTYRVRLITITSFVTTSEERTFRTLLVSPTFSEVRARDATQTSAMVEARINPNGSPTNYRFEWGTSTAYGHVVPAEFEPALGSGHEASLVTANLTGLATGTIYHYRVVAHNGAGTNYGPDQTVETLNSCGLPEGRCFELVSRREAGPVAIPGEANAHIEIHYQAATAGSGAFAYTVESGYPDATKGADILYRGIRGPDEWESTQLSAPISALNERGDDASVNSQIGWISDDLSCGFVDTISPLTPDPSMNLIREEGGSNLYRINPDNSYTPITVLPPQNGEGTGGLSNYGVAWGSQDCGVTMFTARYTYSGIPGKATPAGFRLYEWRDGSLRNAGIVPGPGGEEVMVPATPGSSIIGEEDTQNTVSEDGSRIFFTANRQTSPDPAEIGKTAVFVREEGRETRDVSLSETAIPDERAIYQWATADGSRVFFTANAGLTEDSNTEGTDLYEYDLETERLTDRSTTQAQGGAEVTGFLGASADGSQVYFASRNQLVANKGNSRAENVSANSYSIYGERGKELFFAGTFNQRDARSVLIANQGFWVSQVTPDGRYLLFESSARNTGYENGNVNEVYLYDADAQETTCVSCRQDGQPSQNERYERPEYSLLMRGESVWNPLHPPQFLTERNGEAMVFFTSPDPLAPGAVAGQNNIYEWSHGQIFRLVSAPEGTDQNPYGGVVAVFGGASADGSNIYLITPETLSWEDGDERLSAYDARIGGGFPQPPSPVPPCQAGAENSCQAPPLGVPVTPGLGTGGDSGAQNFEAPKKSAHKKKNKHKKNKHKKKSKRQANGNRRTGK